jgi:hypothetical protein
MSPPAQARTIRAMPASYWNLSLALDPGSRSRSGSDSLKLKENLLTLKPLLERLVS